MMFQNKLDRAMNWLKKQRNTGGSKSDKYSQYHFEDKHDLKEERQKEQSDFILEKKDVLALILSALIVFGPVILIMLIIAILMFI